MERGQLVGPLRLFPGVLERIEDVLVILPRLHSRRGDNNLGMDTGSGWRPLPRH